MENKHLFVWDDKKCAELNQEDKVVLFFKRNDLFVIMEQCDRVYEAEYTKKEFLELIEELKQWAEYETE